MQKIIQLGKDFAFIFKKKRLNKLFLILFLILVFCFTTVRMETERKNYAAEISDDITLVSTGNGTDMALNDTDATKVEELKEKYNGDTNDPRYIFGLYCMQHDTSICNDRKE